MAKASVVCQYIDVYLQDRLSGRVKKAIHVQMVGRRVIKTKISYFHRSDLIVARHEG